jgi:ABC-2 type transport system permease protein
MNAARNVASGGAGAQQDPSLWHATRTLLFQARIFLKRGFIHNSSYRLNFSLSIVNVLVGLMSYYFLSKIVGSNSLGVFSDNPAAFIISGTTLMTFVSVSLASYAGSIRSEMFLGTIEHWLLSASPLTRLVFLSTLWEFAWPLVTSTITFAILATVIGVHFDPNLLTTLVFFLLTVVVMSGFGLISAGIIMVSKIGDPLSTAWGIVTSLLSGSLFPITVLPGWMQGISHGLPTYYALNGIRGALIQHHTVGQELQPFLILTAFAVGILPLGILAFRLGFERARSQGTLAQF